jgi:(1->4)-alpha-D-glucan 1-alpha-D-glucosylmutase
MDAPRNDEYCARIVGYMHKAMREAKVSTSWINPSEAHEAAMERFVRQVLAPDNAAFREDFIDFQRRVAWYGVYNSLSQLAIKTAAPGVPDFYQGTELWDFSLVDPDNRRPVDYARRQALLAEVDAWTAQDGRLAVAERLAATPGDDRLKLYVTATLLRFRRTWREPFDNGTYEPVVVDGAGGDHVFAFVRRHASGSIVVAAPRLITALSPDADVPPLGERVWSDTTLTLPGAAARGYRDIFTGCTVAPADDGVLRASELFAHFPLALLEARSAS